MEILFAFIIALLVSLLFLPYKKGKAASLLVFFLLLFLAALASQYWIVPFGPVLWKVSWLPMLFIVIIFALLFSSPSPVTKIKTESAASIPEETTTVLTAISVFVWILFCLLLLAIILGLYHSNKIDIPA